MNNRNIRPPKIAERLLYYFLPADIRNTAPGDFEEEYVDIAEECGHIKAISWYWKQVVKSIFLYTCDSISRNTTMFKNYLKIAFRNLIKYKGYSFINISGLAIGMAVFILIYQWVQNELSYDRFHRNADNIYRIICNFKRKNSEDSHLNTSYILAKTLREEYSDKFQATQIKSFGAIITIDSKSYGNERIIGADNSFFNVFTYEFIIGDPKTALNSPNDVIITDETAVKYFGNVEAFGQSILIGGNTYKITGIIKNNHHNSHFNFDVVFSLQSYQNYGDTRFLYNYYSTYVMLPQSVPVSRLKEVLAEYVETNLAPIASMEGTKISYGCEPLPDIHLHSYLNGPYGANSRIEYVYIFSVISLIILIIACINYINLTSAKNLARIREVGIRKVVGSTREQILKQFLLESVVFSWIAMIIALLLTKISLPIINSIAEKSLELNYINNPLVISGFILLATIIGVISGIYPALLLSSFKPVKVLSGTINRQRRKLNFQNALVIFQYTISVIFIISTLVIKEQLDLIHEKNLGFNKEQVIVLKRGGALGRQKDVFKNNLLKHPDIVNVTGTSSLPGREFDSWSITPENVMPDLLSIFFCDYNFAETMGIDIQRGRFFSKEFTGDERAIIINEEAVEQFGWTENPIGRKIKLNVHGDYTVIGVVNNFHYETLHNKLGKIGMIITQGKYFSSESYLAIRYSSQNTADVISTIKKEWNSIIPNAPFEYSFFDEDFYRLYRSEQQMQKISLLFSLLAIFISVLGMLGLVSFAVEKSKKEIGVRKVLGASAIGVQLLLCRELLKWILLAIIIAGPIAYYTMHRWLQDFAFKISISPWIFIVAGMLTLGITILTISYQSIKAATANPVDSLRYE